ncbi:Bacterial protein of uncharacterised function (DUF945) [Citrobacter koseri]|uniref:Bacterial protein of uncharacterized function (DUF945) n=1 Tax=Citrobacter koseri TaxID=545 RepID=A0A2X2WGV6_CITKO|nr:Bacterial protein of uncharacterised function (DUF945) [Citrobacter koseri]
MKKSLVATGVIVALGVVWTGGAWYTGKKLETHLAQMVNQANEQLKRTAPEAAIELSYQNYQRGIFSSQLQLVAKPVEGKENPLAETRTKRRTERSGGSWPFPVRTVEIV